MANLLLNFALIVGSIAGIFVAPRFIPEKYKKFSKAAQAGFALLAFMVVASTSFIYIEDNETGHLVKIYGTQGLKDGKIIAFSGEKGPQARILPPGFNFEFLLNVINNVSKKSVIGIPEGKYGYLVAFDGTPFRPDQTYADAIDPQQFNRMVNNAEIFLSEGGQKGPQTSILTPGIYRLNHFLWQVTFGDATDIPKGFVGVIKSNVHSRVQFGNLKEEKPTDCSATQKRTVAGEELAVPLVPVGCIGIWETALLPGKYYINQKAYDLNLVDTRVQTWEYKGGYSLRTIDLIVKQDGHIEQKEFTKEIPIPKASVGPAVTITVEGWNVPQELRVLVQVTPANAPMVVASVGGLDKIEKKILTPAIRSVVRNVGGGTLILQEFIRDKDGELKKDADGKILTHEVVRPTRVMDLIESRDTLQQNMKKIIQVEGMKAGVDIKEIRLGFPAIPPELLVARRREQLAQQLQKAYIHERKAQEARIKTEQARATADKQPLLVEAEIEVRRSKEFAIARKNEGQGEKDKLELIAQGQAKQVAVLGQNKVVELRKFEITLTTVIDFLDKHPEVLTTAISNAHKFVPDRVFTLGGESAGGLAGAFGILGDFLSDRREPPREKSKK